MVPGNRNTVILPNLDPDTPYKINVQAIYPDGPGGDLDGDGHTGTLAHSMLGPLFNMIDKQTHTVLHIHSTGVL